MQQLFNSFPATLGISGAVQLISEVRLTRAGKKLIRATAGCAVRDAIRLEFRCHMKGQ